MKLIFATNNSHKIEEVRMILGQRVELKTLLECGITEDIPETAPTLQGNALIKARYIHNLTGENCFADDTGLEVDILDGAPGVHSARYASGVSHDSKANMDLLLSNLEGKSNRKARFRTVIALILDNKEYLFQGVVDGQITLKPSGDEGFGYDPVFVADGYKETFAQMDSDQKNAISHRGQATRALCEFLLKH